MYALGMSLFVEAVKSNAKDVEVFQVLTVQLE